MIVSKLAAWVESRPRSPACSMMPAYKREVHRRDLRIQKCGCSMMPAYKREGQKAKVCKKLAFSMMLVLVLVVLVSVQKRVRKASCLF